MKIAIVGATGEVGRMMLKVVEEFKIAVDEICLFASVRSVGKKIKFKGKELVVKELTEDSLKQKYDYILMSAGATISKKFSPIAAKAGNTVIDNSSAFRQDKNIPLVVPEINSQILKGYKGIVANPNCSTIQVVLALYPLAKKFGLKKTIITTYQSVSGSGNSGIQALYKEQKGSSSSGFYPKEIFMNVIPQIGNFFEDGYCEEEAKLIFESKKIMGLNNLLVSTTNVRVPVIYGHSEAVYAEFEKQIKLEDAKNVLKNAPSVIYQNDEYITPKEIGDSNDSFVSRLRYGVDNRSLTFWNVAHNIRVGAATNAVRIMKSMKNFE